MYTEVAWTDKPISLSFLIYANPHMMSDFNTRTVSRAAVQIIVSTD